MEKTRGKGASPEACGTAPQASGSHRRAPYDLFGLHFSDDDDGWSAGVELGRRRGGAAGGAAAWRTSQRRQ